MKIETYKNLIVWQKAIDLVQSIYELTRGFPSEEIFGLSIQMRRAAISIPSNIAEGSKRSSRKDFAHFLYNAFGSGAELETQIVIAKRLFSKNQDFRKCESLLDEIMRMLTVLIQKLK